MRNHLFKMTLIVGLMTSFACLADDGMDSCLKDNADKPDMERMAFCNGKINQAAADAKKKELQKKYEDALAELNKQQPSPAKTQPAPTPSESTSNASSDNTSSGSSTTAGSTTSANEAGTPSGDNTTPPSSTSEKAGATNSHKMTQPVPRDKPTGVQWY